MSLREILVEKYEKLSKADLESTPVTEYEYSLIKEEKDLSYKKLKEDYGPLADTDPARLRLPKKDTKFRLSEMVREPLSIEEEEERFIAQMVQEKVDSLAEEAKKKGYELGLIEGREEGIKQAKDELRDRATETLSKFEAFIEECENAKTEVLTANEEFLIRMIYQIAEMVTLKEVKEDKDYLIRLAKNLIERIGIRKNITILISEENREVLNEIKDSLYNSFADLQNLEIQVSEKVKGSGCLVETEWSKIDATVETQLENLKNSLLSED